MVVLKLAATADVVAKTKTETMQKLGLDYAICPDQPRLIYVSHKGLPAGRTTTVPP